MYWSDDSGTTWNRITDHNRSALNIGITRIGTDNRMVNGRLRRYAVTKKRQITTSWDMVPAFSGGTALTTADGGWGGSDIKSWHDSHDGSFLVQLRKGSDVGKTVGDGTVENLNVMITDFSYDVEKRGPNQDLWSVSITLDEV
jgi:hypothetical protein